jgi:diguanylate cyclase (GGDEF)-like protein
MVDSGPSSSPPSVMFLPEGQGVPGRARREITITDEPFGRHHAFDAKDAVIMMVDDEPLNIEMTRAFLEEAGWRRFVSTEDSERALDIMREKRPHVLLLDLSMPKVSGMDILEMLRDDETLRHTPVIVLTVNNDAQVKLNALSLGAMDFLAKPVDPSELALRLRNTLAARAHRDWLAQHDPLTGLLNRLRYTDEVEAAIRSAGERKHGCAVLHLGVDRLSQVNDGMGRAAGDMLLQRIAKRLRQCVDGAQGGELGELESQHLSLYRFDGDEFAILIPYLEEVETAAGFISDLLQAATLNFRLGDREVFATASLGVAVFPLDGRTADQLISNAGVAMRQAKHAGRNTYEFFSRHLNERAVSTLKIGSDLRRAISREELGLLYQPKIDVATGKLAGAEAVLLWTRPQGEVIEGSKVAELADTAEMRLLLADWAVNQAGKQLRQWENEKLGLVPLGIDVSLRELPLARLAEVVQGALKAGAPAEFLCIEFSEAAEADMATLAVTLARLREWGLRLALDNFGTPQSGLGHLAALAFDEVKTDPSLMFRVEDHKPNAVVMQTVIAMANGLGVTLVATGVQTPAQLAFLKTNGAPQCQGKLFNNPLSPMEFATRWLTRR